MPTCQHEGCENEGLFCVIAVCPPNADYFEIGDWRPLAFVLEPAVCISHAMDAERGDIPDDVYRHVQRGLGVTIMRRQMRTCRCPIGRTLDYEYHDWPAKR